MKPEIENVDTKEISLCVEKEAFNARILQMEVHLQNYLVQARIQELLVLQRSTHHYS